MSKRPRPLVVSGLGFLLASCPGARNKPVAPDGDGQFVDDDDAAIAKPEEGLQFTLHEGRPEAVKLERPKVAQASPLADKEARALLARLPALTPDPADVQPFALRPASQPPPKTGKTVLASFPGPAQGPPPAVKPGPLAVLRHTPDGEVPVAADLSVTFSQPMVAVAARSELAEAAAPVKLSPQPPGRWVWVGTRTLVFRPTGRFPMATEYSVSVPAGVAAADGSKLASGTSFKFATPPPKLVASAPRDTTAIRSPNIALVFDQKIDPAAALSSIKVAAARGEPVALKLVPRAEALKDEAIRATIEAAEDGRWLVVRPSEPLPGAVEVTVTLAAGLPSAEGPRTTTTADSFRFHTFGALKVQEAMCGWDKGYCPPGAPLRFTFNNPLDERRFKKEWVTVTPELRDMSVAVFGNELHVNGRTKARTSYTVTIAGALRDQYRQTLGAPAKHTFRVGVAPESLAAASDMLTVLDPAGGGKFSVFSTGYKELRVRVHAVTPADWSAYLTYARQANEDALSTPTPPGKPVFTDTIKVRGDVDEQTETRIDLAAALRGGLGHAIVVVEPTTPPKQRWMRHRVITWAQSTKIGLDAYVDGEQLVAFATGLADAKPLAGVQLQLLPPGAKASTGADGLASFALPPKSANLLLATQGEDTAFVPEAPGWWHDPGESGWRPYKRAERVLWYVFDDRQLYRPGETARVKGWLRKQVPGPRGALAPAGARTVKYVLRDSQGNELLKGDRPVNALGGFDLALVLPKTPNLGHASLELKAEGTGVADAQHYHGLRIEEFRRPEYEVTARVSEGPHLVGESAELTVSAKYFAGGALPDAEVQWNAVASPATYTPPGRDQWTFGRWRPWWGWGWDMLRGPGEWYREHDSFPGRTDAAGEHHLRAEFVKVTPPGPSTLMAEASVIDVNRQRWTASTSLLVHPARLYVGMKSERLFVQQGQALDVDAIVTDIDGKAVGGREVLLRAARLSHEQDGGEWKEVEKDPQDCKKTAAGETPVRCSFTPKSGGTYRVTASVTDAEGRRNESSLMLWVAGEDAVPSRDVAQQQVQLVPDKKEYAAGETARLLVLAPFAPAEGVLTLRREGLVQTRRISLSSSSTTLEIPIDDAWAPGIAAQVDLVGAAPRAGADGRPDPKLPKRPAYATGTIELAIPPRSRSLELYLKPGADKIEPGGSTSLEVLVHDAQHKPVAGGEVAVVVVDEAVLALTGHDLADPLQAFYPTRDAGVRDHHSRSSVVLANPDDTGVVGGVEGGMVGGMPTTGAAPGGGGGDGFASGRLGKRDAAEMAPAPAPPPAPPMQARDTGGDKPAPMIALRKNFDALALFAAALPTDAQGRAKVDIKLPDNLTRYRIMAVAVAGSDRYGKADTTLTARLPLMVRPSPPRFLNMGDRFELPVVLQNQTDAPLTVDLAARAANLDLTQGFGRKVQVPANDRVEVRLPAAAARPGTARFQVAAASGKWSDAATGELPVWTPATTEAFATYGQIDAGAVAQPISAPKDAFPQFGGLEITTTSTAVAELTDAVLYLVRYPFECSEQLASRTMTIAALKDVLAAFQAAGLPTQEALLAFVGADIERLARLQNPDGGWGFWRRGERSWPYLSVHVAHALERARGKGFTVPPATLDRAQDYLKTVESHFGSEYSAEARRPIVAYALYVRQRLGVRDQTRARTLFAEVPLEKHSLETLGWLLPVLGDSAESKAILRHLGNQVRETAGAAHFTTGYSDGAHLLLHSERRVDGVLLEALIGVEPQSDLIPKLVRGLLNHRKAGRWDNTQENALILLALDRYFATYEKATPDFVARAWLGDLSAGQHKFKGRTTEKHHAFVPMETLNRARGDLVLAKDGPGRLYYRVGLRYAPQSLQLPPAEFGFVVERKYEALDDPKDVRRDPDGTWRIRAGARVKVTLTMVAQDRRYHVALVDPLPAGLEPVNPELATTGKLDLPRDEQNGGGPVPYGSKRGWSWWWGPWYEHQNLRDERVEAFTSLLWDGVHNYTYTARATTPGAFVVPPARAEEMYAPETFGRSASDRVIVE
jgi:hypothetical protein